MSGVERDKIKSLIELRQNSAKVKFLILGDLKSSSLIIKKLFDTKFNKDDLIKRDLDVKILNLEKNITICHSEIKDSLEFDNFECILCSISLLDKRIDKDELEKIKKIISKNKKIILVLTNIEKLDLRELQEMKAIIDNELKEIDILTVMDLDIKSEHNEWMYLVKSIKKFLNERSNIGFMKAQVIDNSFKNRICDDIVEFYINIFDYIEVDELSEGDLLYIQTNMASEMLALYKYSDVVNGAIIELIEKNINKLISVKRNKIEEIIRLEEKKRFAKQERERKEQERIKKEKQRKFEEEKRLKEEARANLIKEQERIRKEEKLRLDEEERVKRETEAKIKQEEERLKREEEQQLKEEKEAKRKAKQEEKRKKAEAELKDRREKLKQQKIDLMELKKLEEERKVLNEKIKKLNKNLKKNSVSNNDLILDDTIIEASFTVDDSTKIEPKSTVNELEMKVDAIIYEAIVSKIEELVEDVKNEIKEKLKDSSII